jgi:tRNA pseudouridine38-40 synthase
MRNLKITVQYDGTEYVGWQRQPDGTSIQGLLEAALQPIEGQPVTVHGAGRTDAGVHALAQVASVQITASLEPATLVRALNAVLPLDVRVLQVDEVSAEFHARFSATGKTYEYRIVNAPFVSAFLHRYAWQVAPPLDVGLMRRSADALVGRHDFAGFQGAGADVHTTERTIRSVQWQEGAGFNLPIVMRISGDGFLRHMVRNIVGTLVEIGAGRWERERLVEALASRDRTRAGPTAPARGLFLVDVDY